MDIGHITPWGVHNGIAVYAERLIRGLARRVRPHVVGFDLDDQGKADIDIEAVVEHMEPVRVVHLQYSRSLYADQRFEQLLQALRAAGKRLIVTAHTPCPAVSYDHLVVHRMGHQTYMTEALSIIPIGIDFWQTSAAPAQQRSVCCVGPCDVQDVAAALDHVGGGVLSVVGDAWMDEQQLLDKMVRSQILVMNYKNSADEQPSKWAALAAGAPRPLVVSGVPRLAHVVDLPGVAMADTIEQLAICFDYTFGNYSQVLTHVWNRPQQLERLHMRTPDVLAAHEALYKKIDE